jgi:uncharacterized protein (TIGR03437 family)
MFRFIPALAMLGFSTMPLLSAAEDRIVRPVANSRMVSLPGHVHPAATAQNDIGPVDSSLELSYVSLLFKPAPGLEQFLAEQQNPASPNFHRWLTPEQFGDRFGLTTSDTDKVAAWLRSQGLRVHDVARGRHWISFSGTASQVGRAFRTEIHRYRVNGETHFANATSPSTPEAFHDVVAGIEGLHDFEPKPMNLRGRALVDGAPQYTDSSGHYLAPNDIATIYNIAPLYAAGIDGTGQKIAVIGRTDVDPSNLRKFRTRFGLPPNDPQVVLVGPDPGTIPGGDTDEANLDLEWSGATARNATIVYVNSLSVRTSVQYAIDQNLAPIITYSYGSCERSNSPALRYLAQQANAQGITWLVASGDQGAGTCDTTSFTPQIAKGPTVSYPASVPEVTAVGGTTFKDSGGSYWAPSNDANGASALSYIPETAWNDSVLRNDFIGTGGGVSSLFPKPFWQTGPGVPNDNFRDVPDVSLAASADHDGYLVYVDGGLFEFGGTSVGTPIMAGVVALLNQYLVSKNVLTQPGAGNINPTLYRLAQSANSIFHDITIGDNRVPCAQSSPGCVNGLAGYPAGPGYDLATGLGSIDANNLVTKWDNGVASKTVLTASPLNVDLTGSVQLTATVTGQAGAAPSGNVTFLVNDALLGTSALNAGTATLTADASIVAGGTGIVSALYSGDGTYASSSGTVTVTLNLPSAGSLVVAAVTPNPVYQTTSTSWPYVVTLTEKNGVATKLTGFTVNGTDNSANIALLNNGNIPARGSVAASLSGNLSTSTVPLNRTFIFSGADPDGRKWTAQTTVPFVGPAGPLLLPAIAATSTPKIVQRNPQADPSCAWSQAITVQEQSGFLVQLTSFIAGTDSFTSQIQQIFGTTRLAPFGVLRGTLCWNNITPPATKTITIAGSAENGAAVTSSVSVQYQAAAGTPSSFTASTEKIALSIADSQHDANSTVDIAFGGASQQWSLAILPGNAATRWLKVTPTSGSGAATLTVQASGAGLSPGVYQGMIAVESPGAVPSALNIPVTLAVAPSGTTTVTALTNGGSYQIAAAPGMLASVFGIALAPTVQLAGRIPLPLVMQGVSATVNGISAPLYYVSSGQLNIQIPYEVGVGPAVLAVNNNGQIASFPITVSIAAPGLFGNWDVRGVPASTAQQGQVLISYVTGDGDETPFLPTGDTIVSSTPLSRIPKPRLPLTMTVGGVPAQVLFAGIPSGLTGVTQINYIVPPTAPLGPQPVVVTLGTVQSPPVMLTVTAAQ